MNGIFTTLLYEMEKHHDTVLCTIIADSGSTPRGKGAQMLVGDAGLLSGTIGGGAVEGGAIALGPSWAVLDPIAAVIVSVLIIITAWKLMANALGELLEKSLPETIENEIENTVTEDPMLSDIHHLRTRRIGNHIAIDMHVRMPGEMTLCDAHKVVSKAEGRLRDRYGAGTFISIHMEPRKEKDDYGSMTAGDNSDNGRRS